MSNTPTHPQAIGIDFGGTSVKIGVCQGSDIIEKVEPIVTSEYVGAAPMIGAINGAIASLRQRYPDIQTIGAGMPGFVNWATGEVHALTNVQGWEGVNLREELHASTNLPCIVENDANAMTYAEWKFGAGRGRDYLLAITLGTGVGGGLILDGQLYRGVTYGAGEVGQISIDFRGRKGGHGNHGALERYVGNGPFTRMAHSRYESSGIEKSLAECRPDLVAKLASEGDPVAIGIWKEVGERLAIGIANVLWVMNLDCVVIGGGMAKAGDLLFAPLQAHLEDQMDPAFTDCVEIIHAHFGNEAGLIGAAALAVNELDKA